MVTHKLLMLMLMVTTCGLITLFHSTEAKFQQTCPCPALTGPPTICPNTLQNIVVVNAPAGAFAAFSVPSGSTGNIVSQSGLTAIVNQPGSYVASVCFPLSITIPTGTNCGVNCNNPLVTASLSSNIAGNPATVTICQTGPSPSSVTLTCNTNVLVNPATTTYRFFLNGALLVDSPSNTLSVNFNTFVGNSAAFTCRAITQSTQCISPVSNTITVVKCTSGGLCPTVVTLTALDQCPSFRLRATINNPQINTVYTFTLRRSATLGGPSAVVSIQTVGPLAVIPPGGISTIFSGLPPGQGFFIVDVNVPGCPIISSNVVSLPNCGGCQPVGSVLSSNRPGNPSSLTICTTPPGPSTIILTCTATSPAPGAIYRFFRNGVVVAQGSSRVLVVSFPQFATINVANYFCQVITQPGSCIGTTSNVITIQRCTTGGGACPTAVTLTPLGQCPSFSLQATVSNPQINTIYTFTLRRSTGGPSTLVSIQTVGPFAVIPVGGITAIFSGLPPGSAFFVVDVNVPNCPIISSNIVNLPDCGCQSVGAVLSSNQPGNPASLTICTTPPGPSIIVLTCTASTSSPGATYRFIQNGVTVAESASNTLSVTIAQFATINLANYFCQVITQPGSCVGSSSNVITIQRCAAGSICPTTVQLTQAGQCPTLSLQATVNNPQTEVTYTFVLRRSTTAGGSFTPIATQSVGPFMLLPVGGITAVFSGLPAGNAFYIVDVVADNCPIIFSNTVNLPACCQSTNGVLSSDQPGNPSSLTICTTPPGPSTIVLTCTAASPPPGTTYRFIQNGVTVAESASNTLAVTFAQFATITLANFACQVITQPGTCIGPQSNVISIQRCTAATCPTAVTLTSIGTCPSFSLQASISNPQVGVTYTFTLRRSTTSGGPFSVIASQTVGPFASIPSGGIAVTFSGLPAGAAFFIVDVSAPNCPTISSNTVNLPECCQNTNGVLSSDQPNNPSSLTICTTPPGPSTIVLTCTAASPPPGTTYRFLQNGVTVAESASNTLTVTFAQFATIALANYACQVITQPGACVGPQSNIISIQRCTCPTAVTLTAIGSCPTLSLQASISNPQVGVTYTFTLRRSTAAGGPFSVIASQTVGPFASIPSGGISATFSGLPAGAAFFIVDVSTPNCPTISSNTVNLPACCQSTIGVLSSDQPNNPASLTICTTPPGPSTIVLTCTAVSPPPGTTYRFTQNGVTVSESASNTLTVTFDQFSTIALANYACQVITQPGTCVGPTSNVISIQRCTCPTAVTLTSVGSCPSFSLQASISNPQVGVTYTFTLRRSTTAGGPFSVIAGQTLGPFASIPSGGITATFSGLPAGAAFFIVDVSTANCPTISSNTVNLPACCQNTNGVLSSDQPGNPTSLTICATPPGPSSIVLTCTAVSPPPGTTYRFIQNGVTVAESASNTLTVTLDQFSTINSANYACQVITQPGTCVGPQSNVISIQRCTCPTAVTLTAIGSCPSFSLQASISNPQVGVVYTFTLRGSPTAAGPFSVIASQSVGPFASIPSGGITATFSGLPPGASFFIVDVSTPNCPTIPSNTVNLPACCQTTNGVLSSDQPGNPASLTICTSPPGPSTIVLTCTAASPPPGTTYRFTQNGVTVAESASNTLAVTFGQFSTIALANYACQVITQPGTCVGPTSNVISIQRCTCPTAVTLTSVGSCPSFSLQASISDPQVGVTYTFTLRRSTTAGGPFSVIAGQTLGPFASIPSGGITATFGGLPAGAAFFIVDVSTANCPTISSNTVNLPNCCQPIGAVLSSNQPNNPSSLTICTAPPGPATIVLTCTASSSVVGAQFRFIQNGTIVQETGSNTLTIRFPDFQNITSADYSCLVITQPGSCVGTLSNVITITVCNLPVCNTPVRPRLISTVNNGRACIGQNTTLQCIPAACANAAPACLAQFRYQLARSSGGILPGPTGLDFQVSSLFNVTPLPNETFNCRVIRAEPCVGDAISPPSLVLNAAICPVP